MTARINRRRLLQTAAIGTAALAACQGGRVPDAARRAAAELGPFAFTDQERRTLSAAVARLIPAEGPGDWSAADAGAVEYIEQLLNAFAAPGDAAQIHAGGPTRPHFETFVPLPRIKQGGWAADLERLRRSYRDGLAELDRRARGPLAAIAGDFAALPAAAQDAILTEQDLAGTEFFAELYAHTMEGVYSHPVYGGNRDFMGWDSVSYQGDVHGVRYPAGAPDPTADDRPWDKFGGYAPEEMIQPGPGPGWSLKR